MGDYVSASQAAALRGNLLRLGIFFKLAATETEPALCLWSGIQNREATMPAPPTATIETYIGTGTLIDAPEISHIANGEADDVTFSLSALAGEVSPFLVAETPKVRGRLVQLALGIFDNDWQLIGDLLPVGIFTASQPTFKGAPPTEEYGPHTHTVGLITQSGDTSRSRGSPVFWSPGQWGRQHAGSTFTNDVARLQRGVAPNWPAFK